MTGNRDDVSPTSVLPDEQVTLMPRTAATRSWSVGGACVHRCDHGLGTPLTLAECVAAVEHPLTGLSRAELVEVVAYLSAQVVGFMHRQSVDAPLALQQIAHIVKEHEERSR